MKKEPNMRTDREIIFLVQETREVEFFDKLYEDSDGYILHKLLCKNRHVKNNKITECFKFDFLSIYLITMNLKKS